MTNDQATAAEYMPLRQAEGNEPCPADIAFLNQLDENRCPECESGQVIETGRQCRETGHTPLGCSHNCGWSA